MDSENTMCHNAFLYNRSRIEMSGISDVISFSENSVEAEYGEGSVVIEGENMRIEDFSGELGKLTICGTVNGFYYFTKTRKESRKLFGTGRK